MNPTARPGWTLTAFTSSRVVVLQGKQRCQLPRERNPPATNRSSALRRNLPSAREGHPPLRLVLGYYLETVNHKHQLARPCQKTIARDLGIEQRSIQSSAKVALEFQVIRIEFHDRDAAITAGVPIRATYGVTPKLNVLCPITITELEWL